MYKLLLLSLFTVVWMMMQALQTDSQMAIQTLFHGKHAVNRAAHAAAQQLDMTSLANGALHIDEQRAAVEADRYLIANLYPEEHRQNGAELGEEATVIVLDVINSEQRFPYTYRRPEYNYEVTLHRPAVVMIVRLRYQRAFSVMEPVEWEIKGAAELVSDWL
ncbi:hypothetical protein EBB07_21610 [Paenibacillaceae bacterium]|nr:hypothetical protein EBB07_21610 [Paenibacillaceae bacterium]